MTEAKNADYYRKLRRNNPSEYFSKRVQLELMRNASKDVEKFYGTAPAATPSRDPRGPVEADVFDDEDFEEGDDE